MQSMGALDDVELIADIAATADYLRGRADHRAGALGIVGHCMGGRCAFLGASTYSVPAAESSRRQLFKPWAREPGADRAVGNRLPVVGFSQRGQNPRRRTWPSERRESTTHRSHVCPRLAAPATRSRTPRSHSAKNSRGRAGKLPPFFRANLSRRLAGRRCAARRQLNSPAPVPRLTAAAASQRGWTPGFTSRGPPGEPPARGNTSTITG